MASTSRKLGFALVFLATLALIFAAGVFVVRNAATPYQRGSTRKELVEVGRGTSPMAVSEILAARGVVRNATLFYWLGKVRGTWPKLKAGEYEVSPAMSPMKVMDVITSGISVGRPFLVREGMNSYEIANDLEAKGYGKASRFLALIQDPKFIASLGFLPPLPRSLEGYLYPDTYSLQRKMTLEEIARNMVKRFQSVWGPNENARAHELGLSRHEVVTLASIVEKETGSPDERPAIAGVFFNRLKKKMKLQSDPTSIYGIWTRYDGNIRKRDLLDPNPFNTYHVPGLPAGPIGNPGIDALRATLYPAEHHYLYFVSQNDGTHVFTATYQDHEKAVAKYQLDRRAREGKSWRDLSRKDGASANGASPSSTPAKPR